MRTPGARIRGKGLHRGLFNEFKRVRTIRKHDDQIRAAVEEKTPCGQFSSIIYYDQRSDNSAIKMFQNVIVYDSV